MVMIIGGGNEFNYFIFYLTVIYRHPEVALVIEEASGSFENWMVYNRTLVDFPFKDPTNLLYNK